MGYNQMTAPKKGDPSRNPGGFTKEQREYLKKQIDPSLKLYEKLRDNDSTADKDRIASADRLLDRALGTREEEGLNSRDIKIIVEIGCSSGSIKGTEDRTEDTK
jgi:hypothetical protein